MTIHNLSSSPSRYTGNSVHSVHSGAEPGNLVHSGAEPGNLVHSGAQPGNLVHSGAELSIIEPFTKTHAENTRLVRSCGGNFGAFRANTS